MTLLISKVELDMPSRNLLIVDGEALRSPGMVEAFAKAGWSLDWISLLQLQLDFMPESQPDVVLLGPPALSTGEDVAREMRERFPEAVLVGGRARATDPELKGLAATVELQGDPGAWPARIAGLLPAPEAPPAVRAAAPAPSKWTTEDLFGDIVAEIEGRGGSGAQADVAAVAPMEPSPIPTPKPEPAPSMEALPAATAPVLPARPEGAPVKPAPGQRVGAAPLVPRPVPPVPKAGAPLKPTPPRSMTKAPTSSKEALPSLGEELRAILGDEPPAGAAKPPVEEFTLSGISGIHDPFAQRIEDAPEPAPEPAPVVVPPVEPAPRTEVRNPLLDSLQMPILEEFGNYYLMEKIAVGGMAELFKARQRGVHDFQKIVAIKRILPHLSDNDEFVRMFIDEAKLAAQLTHPNIAQIFDLGRVSGFYYIAMEFVDGRDLRSMLRKVREFGVPFPEPIAAFVVMKIAGALDYAHRKRGMDDRELKLVHRDVSPQNVLISSEGAVKLVDFGIAKAATKSTQTVAGALKGKLLYMSPEQALGQPLDHRSDIFSLGLVLFELLTGERCFQADSELGVLEKVRMGRVAGVRTLNPKVSDGMVAILDRALAKELDRRYGSARLMERDLRALLVKAGIEVGESDVAEFTGTLLRGTREQLELQVATRFPPVALPPPEPTLPGKVRAQDVTPSAPTVSRAPEAPLPDPPPYESVTGAQARAPWLLPLVIILMLCIVVLLWFMLRQ